MDVGSARAVLWLPAPRLDSLEAAGRFVGEVGFALAFPAERIMLPSLYEAVAGPDAVAWDDGMGEAESLVWTWKDALPEAGLAWSGKLLHKRLSVVSPELLEALYPGAGEFDDHRAFELMPQAHRIAAALVGGPLPTSVLRELVANRSRYDRAMVQLQQHMLVTSVGVQEQSAGWPVGLVDLTCRVFDVGGRQNRAAAARRFLDTVLEVQPTQLAKAFAWSTAAAEASLDALVTAGGAHLDHGTYTP